MPQNNLNITRRTGLRIGAVSAAGLAIPGSRIWRKPKQLAHAMTVQGDLPDFQSLTTPNFAIEDQLDIGAGVGQIFVSSATPFRIWQAWMEYCLATNASYNLSGTALRATLQDGNGLAFLAMTLNVVKASDHAEESLSLPLYGVRPTINAGLYTLSIVTQGAPANVFMHVNVGVITSNP